MIFSSTKQHYDVIVGMCALDVLLQEQQVMERMKRLEEEIVAFRQEMANQQEENVKETVSAT